MNKVWIEEIRIERIKTEPLFQPRDEDQLDEWHLGEMPTGIDQREPVDVFRVAGEGDLLGGGHYRLEKATRDGRETINARIHEGTRMDCFWFSLGENRQHGKARTSKDVRHAAFMAFDLRHGGQAEPFTDSKLALAMHVTPGWISQLKKEWYTILTAKHGGQDESEEEDGDSDDDFDRGEVENGDEDEEAPDTGEWDEAGGDEDEEEDAAPSKPAKLPPLPDLDFGAASATAAKVLEENKHLTESARRHHIAGYVRKCLQPALGMLEALGLLKKHRKALERLYADARGD